MGTLTKQTLTQILITSTHNICRHTQTYTGARIKRAQINTPTFNASTCGCIAWTHTHTQSWNMPTHAAHSNTHRHKHKTLVFEADDLCQEMTGKWCNVLIQNLFWESVLNAQMPRHNSKCTFARQQLHADKRDSEAQQCKHLMKKYANSEFTVTITTAKAGQIRLNELRSFAISTLTRQTSKQLETVLQTETKNLTYLASWQCDHEKLLQTITDWPFVNSLPQKAIVQSQSRNRNQVQQPCQVLYFSVC